MHKVRALTSTTSPRSLYTALTAGAVGLYWISLYLYVPSLPIYARSMTSELALVGAVLAQYGLWQAIIRLPLGIFSDWLGRRKPLILLGFILAGTGAWVMGRAGGIEGLMVGRAITGLAAGSWVVMVVAFSSLFPPAEAVRATVILTLVNSTCRMLATAVNGPLIDLGGFALAFNLAALVGLGAVLVYMPVPEATFERKKPSMRGTQELVTRRDVLLPSLLNALVQYISWATVFGFLPVLAKSLGASDTILGLMVSMNIGVGVLGNLAAGVLVRRMNLYIILFLGFVLMAAGLIFSALASSLAWIFAAQFLIGFGGGLAYPTLMGMSIEHVDQPQRSTAMGLHQAVYGIGMFAGPWLSGILADRIGLSVMFAATGIASLALGSLGVWALMRPRNEPAQEDY